MFHSHVTSHGETQALFTDVLTAFTAAMGAATFAPIQAMTWDTFDDRFKKPISDHRESVRKNTTTSSIIQVRVERE